MRSIRLLKQQSGIFRLGYSIAVVVLAPLALLGVVPISVMWEDLDVYSGGSERKWAGWVNKYPRHAWFPQDFYLAAALFWPNALLYVIPRAICKFFFVPLKLVFVLPRWIITGKWKL